MAPDAWAQAASMSEKVREEQLLFMMLEDILGDACKPDVSRTTAWSARLAQITDDYAAAVLARSQPDALPHIPSHSNPSQSNQPPPKLRQSAHVRPPSDTEESRPASSAKYEHISLSKVGARPIHPSSHTDIRQNKPPLPEQQADEPRFALQNVATKHSRRREPESSPPPIHPVQPSVATEATPSSIIAPRSRAAAACAIVALLRPLYPIPFSFDYVSHPSLIPHQSQYPGVLPPTANHRQRGDSAAHCS